MTPRRDPVGPPPAAGLRVAMGLHSLQLGGSQVNTLDLATRLRDRGHHVRLFAIQGDTYRATILPLAAAADFDVDVLPTASTLPAQAGHIRRLADDHRADVVHVFHENHWLGPLAALATRRRPGRAVVVTNWMMENSRWLPPHAPLIVGTEALRQEAAARHRGPVWLLEPPVDTGSDRASELDVRRFRSEVGLAPDDVLAVLVTRVDREMKLDGILLAIRAMELLDDERRLRLVIVGDGDAADTVRARADAANRRLGRLAVTLTGALSDPRPAYGAADLVLGMGGSALRGLGFAKPVIVLGGGGFARTFSPATAGYFLQHGFYGAAPPDDGEGLARQMRALLDPAARARLGADGAHTVRSRFSLDRAVITLEQIYIQACARPPGWLQRTGDAAFVLAYDLVHRRVPTRAKDVLRPALRLTRARTDHADAA